MKFTEWLDQDPSRGNELAKHLRISWSAVVQWRHNGVPVKRMKAVHEFTRRKVSLSEMLPDSTTTEEAKP